MAVDPHKIAACINALYIDRDPTAIAGLLDELEGAGDPRLGEVNKIIYEMCDPTYNCSPGMWTQAGMFTKLFWVEMKKAEGIQVVDLFREFFAKQDKYPKTVRPGDMVCVDSIGFAVPYRPECGMTQRDIIGRVESVSIDDGTAIVIAPGSQRSVMRTPIYNYEWKTDTEDNPESMDM